MYPAVQDRVTATGLGLSAPAAETPVPIVFLASVAGFKRFYLLLFLSPYHPRYDKTSLSFFPAEPEEAEEEEELFKPRTGTNGHAQSHLSENQPRKPECRLFFTKVQHGNCSLDAISPAIDPFQRERQLTFLGWKQKNPGEEEGGSDRQRGFKMKTASKKNQRRRSFLLGQPRCTKSARNGSVKALNLKPSPSVAAPFFLTRVFFASSQEMSTAAPAFKGNLKKALAGLRRFGRSKMAVGGGAYVHVFPQSSKHALQDFPIKKEKRLASQIATVIQGKDKPTYTPYREDGDMCIVLNAKDICVTGRKLTNKFYRWHTGARRALIRAQKKAEESSTSTDRKKKKQEEESETSA
ncbi:hypothetical protein ACLOJK_012012 [Asimina triloba]